jgi:hypothetical protein
MKQTAVEWLFEQVVNRTERIYFLKELKQAKEMEKQQIIEAHGNKQKTKSDPDSIVTYGYTFTGEAYYNKTFKKTEQ